METESVGSGYTTFIAKCLASPFEKLLRIKDKWFIDSGASAHMSNTKQMFSSMDSATVDKSVSVENDKETSISGTGIVHAKTLFEESSVPVRITDALYVSEIMCNIISVSRPRQAGFTILFDSDEHGEGFCIVSHRKNSVVILKAHECADGL